MEIALPSYVFDLELSRYIDLLLEGSSAPEIVLNFRRVKFFIPGAVVGTIAIVRKWQEQGRQVCFCEHEANPACGYLQRIDFFERLGFNIPEDGARKDSSGRFVPIEEVTESQQNVQDISARLAECIAPGGYIENPLYQLSQYSLGEVVNNCKQHSRSTGFASAQYTEARGFARIGVADCGRGILASFRENSSPHYVEGMSDLDAIGMALKPRVSSTTHIQHIYGSSPNKGVGLSMLRNLMQQTMGHMVLISGRGWMYQDGNKQPIYRNFSQDRLYPGTLCAVAFTRGEVINYPEMLNRAKKELGLTGDRNTDILFL